MDQTKMLNIKDLEIENLESIKESVVDDLVKSINNVGLLHPIVVNTKNKVVSGRHRILALDKIGIKEIPARVINFGKSEKRALATLDENLSRGIYTVLEYSRMLHQQKELLEELGLASTPGGDRSKSRKTQLESAGHQIGRKTNHSLRTVHEYFQIAEGVPRDFDARIVGSDVEDTKTTLMMIAKADTIERKNEILEEALSKLVKSPKKGQQSKISTEQTLVRGIISTKNSLEKILEKMRLSTSLKNEISAKEGPRIVEDLKLIERQVKELLSSLSSLCNEKK